jgi:hypothetical protein
MKTIRFVHYSLELYSQKEMLLPNCYIIKRAHKPNKKKINNV